MKQSVNRPQLIAAVYNQRRFDYCGRISGAGSPRSFSIRIAACSMPATICPKRIIQQEKRIRFAFPADRLQTGTACRQLRCQLPAVSDCHYCLHAGHSPRSASVICHFHSFVLHCCRLADTAAQKRLRARCMCHVSRYLFRYPVHAAAGLLRHDKKYLPLFA